MLFASATPIVSGKTGRYRDLEHEIPHHLQEYETLNQRYGVVRHAYWISHPRIGPDVGVSVYDISPEGLADMRGRTWDPASAHDRWWLGFVHDVNGVDMLEESPHEAPPEQVWSWQAR